MITRTLTTAALGLTLALTMSACGGDADGAVSKTDREKASAAAIKATGGGVVTDTERGDADDTFAYEVEVTFSNGSDVDVELDEKFAVLNTPPKESDFAAQAEPSAPEPQTSQVAPRDADDRPLTGTTLKKASAAALKAAGGGKVVETGGSDDRDHAYEVDVLLSNNEDVTVELDKSFKVTKIDR
jgi:uncharacterized membrane protein YkoI